MKNVSDVRWGEGTGIKCPSCNRMGSDVINSRPGVLWDIDTVARRRRCKHCSTTWTTVELGEKHVDVVKTMSVEEAVFKHKMREIGMTEAEIGIIMRWRDK